MKKKLFAMALCLVMVLSFLPVSVRAATTVSSVSFTLDYPEAGKTPPATATWLTEGYSIHTIEWYDRTEGRFLESGETIKAGHSYDATLWAEAFDGYSFACENDWTPGVTAYVNGTQCSVSKAFEYKAWTMVCVKYSFPAVPSKGWIKSVDLTISSPAVGEKPNYPYIDHTAYKSTNMVDLPEYVNGINWTNLTTGKNIDPNTPFQSGVPYQVTITIEQKSGYAFVAQPVVRVNGQVASSNLDYGSVLFVSTTFPALSHTHVYTDWQYNSGQHYKNCTDCDEVFFVESHKGGVATCSTKGKCTVCGYEYMEENENHNPDTSKWIARVDMYHFHACKDCGAHCDIEDHRWSPTYLYQDKTGHAWICADCQATSAIEKHNPGPAATETTPQTCKDCGYIITPVKNHQHDLTKVPQTPADCVHEGNIEYYFCTGCNDCFTDAEATHKIPEDMSVMVGALGHTSSDNWYYDQQYHWRCCSVCSEILEETKMLHDASGEKCSTCNYQIGSGELSTIPEANKPAESTQQENFNIASIFEIFGNIPFLLIILVALVCFAAAITATVIILKMKK